MVQIKRPGGWTGFPKRPDVIHQMMQTREEKAEQFSREGGWKLAEKGCSACGGSGWVHTETNEGNRAVYRCECWKRNRAMVGA